ncbi:spore germination protein GerW family protein [Phycisphaerales bacterium AB-hyl4]|uniref:Spore germination protein GerW family protein n=1 Tax=Natronomicrosphaera hydrolytica TaxID=3242702 RepID=A0ABV4U992_9BACT
MSTLNSPGTTPASTPATTEPAHDGDGHAPFIADLAKQLERGGRAAAVFGDPVERDGITVIPVARARWMVGGGQGTDAKGDKGQGGGGGVCASPVGYIEMKNGETSFRCIHTPGGILRMALAALIGIIALRRLL